MRKFNPKTTPRVKGGRVQKKNNWTETADYYNTAQQMPVVVRKRPGPGYRHLLKQRDIHDFIRILPDWDEISKGLNAVVLAPGGADYGYHLPGVVHICAWDADLWEEWSLSGYEDDREILDCLAVPREMRGNKVLVKWTEATARGFQLLAVFLHELGHHHDLMSSKRQLDAGRGEPYAEAYARQYRARIWDRYFQCFKF
jgi:hypothetical protein